MSRHIVHVQVRQLALRYLAQLGGAKIFATTCDPGLADPLASPSTLRIRYASAASCSAA
jgi:hypothetical protein